MSRKIERLNFLNRNRVRNFRLRNRKTVNVNQEELLREELEEEQQSKDTTPSCESTVYVEKEDVYGERKAFNECEVSDEISFENSIFNQTIESDESNYSSEISDSEDDSVCENLPFSNDSELGNQLKKWAVECRITQVNLDKLLKILKPYHLLLPLSSKTLLRSDSVLQQKIKKFNPNDSLDMSEYVYFGIREHLERTVDIKMHKEKVLFLQFNSDGLSLFRSSTKEFWPILGKVYHEQDIYKPFPITIHYGEGKPKSVDNYLNDFIIELNDLLKNGVLIEGVHFEIKIMCFICDRPARSFLKCIKGHTGYYACERCDTKGTYYKNRVIFPSIGKKRTDKSFRDLVNVEHHIGVSPLNDIQPQVNMVDQFVLDFMHLGYLGIMKKLLDYWIGTSSVKLPRESILRISQRLVNLTSQVPSDFQRTTRSLGDINKWKATEFRFFLLYSGPFILKYILPDDLYKHFLLLHVASRILSTKHLLTYANEAEKYLERFVLLAQQLYGLESQIINMHSLLHLVEDIKNMKCTLSEISAFSFENCLGQMKKTLRNGKKPLVQLCKRLEEDLLFQDISVNQESYFQVLKIKKKENKYEINRIKLKNFELCTKAPNNLVISSSDCIIKINSIYSEVDSPKLSEVILLGTKYSRVQPAFDYPTSSAHLSIYLVCNDQPLQQVRLQGTDIQCKAISLQIFELTSDKKEHYVMPLLHCN